MFVLQITINIFFFSHIVASQVCLDDCFVMKGDLEECSIELIASSNSIDGFNLTFVSQYGTNDSEDARISEHMEYILALICYEYGLKISPPGIIPLCYAIDAISEELCPLNCPDNTSCLAVTTHVFNTKTRREVNPSSVVELLQRKESLAALHLADVPLLQAISLAKATKGSSILEDVPIVSWLFVGLGLLVSTLILMKPLWWDRCVKRIMVKAKKR